MCVGLLIVWRFIAIENTVKDVILIGSNRNDFYSIRIYPHIRHHMYTLILQFAVSFDNKFLENHFICFGNRRAAVRMLINDLYRFSSQIRLQQSQENSHFIASLINEFSFISHSSSLRLLVIAFVLSSRAHLWFTVAKRKSIICNKIRNAINITDKKFWWKMPQYQQHSTTITCNDHPVFTVHCSLFASVKFHFCRIAKDLRDSFFFVLFHSISFYWVNLMRSYSLSISFTPRYAHITWKWFWI